MIKLTDLIHGGPQVLKHSNPVISGYGALSPCCSTGPLYQQVLTPQVPPETEMGTWLGELLTGLTECSTKGRGGMAFSLMCPLFLFSAVKSQHILCTLLLISRISSFLAFLASNFLLNIFTHVVCERVARGFAWIAPQCGRVLPQSTGL